ncbi:MAG: hypothetical protein LQ341_003853 [Variospora aurantia]|nr:MAG: hypothetical protein LQ341_003853 [Variospora aurantia]
MIASAISKKTLRHVESSCFNDGGTNIDKVLRVSFSDIIASPKIFSVEENKLEEKLRQFYPGPILRPSSPASSISTASIDEEQELQDNLRRERESYNALVAEGGIPSHPVELGWDVLEHPGEYKDIVSYWKSRSDFLFPEQLKAWREVHDYQQRLRRYFIQRNRLPEYQQRVRDLRRKHGVEGDVTVLEDLDQQKERFPLEDWMEYQYIIFQRLEIFEKKVDEAHQNHQKLNVAQEELDLAKKKLETAQSDRIAGTVARSAWIGLFLDEV